MLPITFCNQLLRCVVSPNNSRLLTALGLVLSLFLFSGNYSLFGQSSQISDYVLLAGDGSCSGSNCGVVVARDVEIDNGTIGSDNDIDVENDLQHGGDIFSLESIVLLRTNQVLGNIYAQNNSGSSSNALSAGVSSTFGGNISVNGDIEIQSGSVVGQVTRPPGSNYTGPAPSGGELLNTPSFNPLPSLPPVLVFPPAGVDDIRSTQTISPGAYDLMRLRGYQTITFAGTGDYVLEKISNTGDFNTFIIDFQNDPSGVVRILVHDDVNLGIMKVQLVNGADPSRIYLETHDNTNGRAFRISGEDFGNGEYSTWYGTVYAPYESIIIGNNKPVNIEGALITANKITLNDNVNLTYAPFGTCVPSVFNLQVADTDTIECNEGSISLSATANASSSSYSWTTSEGNIVSGANSSSPVVDAPGYYVVTVTEAGCSASDSILVVQEACIDPYYPAPVSGKSSGQLGSELGQLSTNSNFQDTSQIVYQINNDSVYIEIIAVQGQYQTLLALLQTPAYGLTNLIDNGLNTLIISGLFPIQNLGKLDSLQNLLVYVRPLFPAIIKRGVAQTQGDATLNAPFVRGGFDVNGEGVKIGVISDSYNKKPGNPALLDISNEDLPGPGNPINGKAVDVLMDYPFGGGTDEGRAMLQIVHDIAPKADLAFRTGYVSAGDFAQGILDLAADSCDIIVDDITYITEPFLSDGIISQAVNTVVGQGVTYISSAGNFGDNSYGSVFNAVPAPGDIVGTAHDFGGGDVYQSVSLQPGNYLMVLQWQDSIYSIGQTTTGTNNDLDFYLTDDQGNTLFGFNRNNLGGDPLEIMPFTVKQPTQSNILIVRESGSDAVPFKLVIFRGALTFNEHGAGTSTIVGHPNAEGAIAVGAVRYDQTPAYGVDPPLIEDFSSVGGTPVGGVVRNKPEICAPNGVNTTVDLGAGDYENDGSPNFFGTSAAAPHAAAVAGLIQSAKLKYEGAKVSPSEMKSILTSSAIDMGTPGFDFESGNGFLQADVSLLTIASPNPVVYSITLLDTSKTPGIDAITVRIEGDFFTGDTKILLRNDTLGSNTVNSSTIETEIPPFTGNPPVTAYNDPITSSLIDGGGSPDSLYLFNSVQKKKVQLVMDDLTKKYGEMLPELTFKVLVDSVPLSQTSLSMADIGLDSLDLFTTATSLSNVGLYLTRATQRVLNLANPIDAGINDLYTWEFYDGQLTIEKMPLTITVKDTSLEYGQMISDFIFDYDYADSLVDPSDSLAVYDSIFVNHVANIADAVVLVNGKARGEYLASSRVLVNADVDKRTYMASSRVLVNARPFANLNAAANGLPDTTLVVDISAESIFDFVDSPDTVTMSNAYKADGAKKEYVASSRVLVNALDLASGRVLVNAVSENGTKYEASSRVLVNAVPIINATVDGSGKYVASGRVLVNGYPIVNGQPVNQDSSEIVLILDEADADTTLTDSIFPFFPVNMILGNKVGSHPIVPAALYNPNFNISYKLGTLTVTPASLTLKADTLTTTYGDSVLFNYSTEGYQYVDSAVNVIKGPPTYGLLDSGGNMVNSKEVDAGVYTIIPDSLDLGDTTDYTVNYVLGQLTVEAANLDVTADSTGGVYGSSVSIPVVIDGFKYDDSTTSIVSGPNFDLFDSLGTAYVNPEVGAGVYMAKPKELVLTKPGNYLINYVAGPLNILKADLNIKARDTSRSQGDPNPVFALDYSGFQYSDGPSDIVSPTATSTANQGSAAGLYSITLSGGSADNYNLILSNGDLNVIGRLQLTVVADTTVVREGSTVSNFNYHIVGTLNPGDSIISEPSFSVNPSNYNNAGVYGVSPSGLQVTNQANYDINYDDGILYVNPYGFFALYVRARMTCIEQVTNHPSGMTWKVTYRAINFNNTDVYVPNGPLNYIQGNYAGTIPEVFPPGHSFFDIYFDGNPIKWRLTTYSAYWLVTSTKTAHIGRRKCKKSTGDYDTDTLEEGSFYVVSGTDGKLIPEPQVFPNPTNDEVYIIPTVADGHYTVRIMETTGRIVREYYEPNLEGELLKVDLANMSTGIYIIEFNESGKSHYFRISKE